MRFSNVLQLRAKRQSTIVNSAFCVLSIKINFNMINDVDLHVSNL